MVEINQGGHLLKDLFKGQCPVKEVRATESKFVRAIPAFIMYENREVIHYKPLEILEKQMLNFRPNQNDRVDALVWALDYLKHRYTPNYWTDYLTKQIDNNIKLSNEFSPFKSRFNKNISGSYWDQYIKKEC